MRILIADDDRMSTMMPSRALEGWGFEIIVAHDGTSAWERIAGNEPPALAVIDWMMPGLDRIEVPPHPQSASTLAGPCDPPDVAEQPRRSRRRSGGRHRRFPDQTVRSR